MSGRCHIMKTTLIFLTNLIALGLPSRMTFEEELLNIINVTGIGQKRKRSPTYTFNAISENEVHIFLSSNRPPLYTDIHFNFFLKYDFESAF